MNAFLPTAQIADIAGVSRQAMHKVAKRAELGIPWRGAQLLVRRIHGIGGRCGLTYQIQLESLPLALQTRWKDLQGSFEGTLRHGSKAHQERELWSIVLAPILVHAPHSKTRGKALIEAASREYLCPDGQRRSFSERTIRRKLSAYEAGRLAEIHGRKRKDSGVRRVTVSRAFDQAAINCGVAPEDLDNIAQALTTYVRSLIVQGTTRKLIATLLQGELAKHAARHGIDLPKGGFHVPMHTVQTHRHYKKVTRYDRDRKAHEDAKPRIIRSSEGMMPMDLVMGDIHPLDIVVARPDGGLATARLIAWYDCATHRVFISTVLCEKGTGIRNAHVIQSFMDMAHEWGLPRGLYLDNGSEYNWADFISDALKLLGTGCGIEAANGRSAGQLGRVIRAKAYNAAAKGAIEGFFRVFESYLSHQPGHIGGNRMLKKSANVGRPPTPFPGTLEELQRRIQAHLAYYNALPQRGKLKGVSPNQLYSKAIMAGWQLTAADPNALRIAFSEEKVRKVSKGRIQHANAYWTSDDLMRYQGDYVTVLTPKYERWDCLPLKDETGKLFTFAERDVAYGYLDPEGAREAHRRSKLAREGIEDLRRDTIAIDVQQELDANIIRLPRPLSAPVGATLEPSDLARHIIARLDEAPYEKKMREQLKIDEDAAGWERREQERRKAKGQKS